MPIWRVLIILYPRVFYQNSPSKFLRVVFQVSPQFFSWATRFSRNCRGFHGTAFSCTVSFYIMVLRHFCVVHVCSVPLVPQWHHLPIQLSVSGRLCWMHVVLIWRTLIRKCLFSLCVWYVNMCVHVGIYVWVVGCGVSCRVWRINSSGIAPRFSLCGGRHSFAHCCTCQAGLRAPGNPPVSTVGSSWPVFHYKSTGLHSECCWPVFRCQFGSRNLDPCLSDKCSPCWTISPALLRDLQICFLS